ncbi:hypothetical protein HV824_05300 [Myxococcus sp. AM009]|uniref:hypothetical protein n=1 Tax=Myxococcus sp. AM009 TaxID=2745137 RepID=UPI001595CE7A|nr:hypothetical protein [Myxococcus sp. AM009]NVI97534.1 hypothetical protein [Myxococcus sp. AM009]
MIASSTTVSMASQTAGTPATWYTFSFAGQGITLLPGRAYTLKLVCLSTYSGAFSMCGNVYADGVQYWLGYSPDSPYDMSFRVLSN